MTFKAPQSVGIYTVDDIDLIDSALNRTVATTSDLSSAGYPTTLNLSNASAMPPAPPTAVSAVAQTFAAMVSWTPPSDNGGTAILDYTVTASPGGETTTVTGDQTSAYISLYSNITYTFTVHATNGIGSSVESSASAPVATPPTAPQAPTNLVVTPGPGSATVSWTPPYDGGLPITSYELRTEGNRFVDVPGNQTSATITGLLGGGRAYQFFVTATNSFSVGEQAGTEPVPIAVGLPDVVTNLHATAGDQLGIVTWDPPLNTGGTPITGYTIVGPNGPMTVAGTQTTATYTGLTNGQGASLTVFATNAVGDGAGTLSNPFLPAPPLQLPETPIQIVASAGDGMAMVSWTEPAGAHVDSYTVTASPGGLRVASVQLSHLITGLTNGVTYTFTVHATNATGSSPESVPSNPVTPAGAAATVPQPPQSVNATPGLRHVSVSWQAPATDGGSPIVSYKVTPSTGGTLTFPATTFNHDFTSLQPGVAVSYDIVATNAIGDSLPADSATAVPYAAPDPPTNVSAIAFSGAALLTWTAPVSDNGSPIVEYDVTTTPPTTSTTVPAAQTGTVIAGLTNGVTYTFTVRASDVAALFTDSAPSNAVTPCGAATVPDVPASVSTTPGERHVLVAWQAPATDGGSPIVSYKVTPSTGGTLTFPATTFNHDFTSLQPGVAVSYDIVVTNAIGDSLPADSATVVPYAAPDPPTNVSVFPLSQSVLLTWTAPVSDHGNPIQGYDITSTPPVGIPDGRGRADVDADHRPHERGLVHVRRPRARLRVTWHRLLPSNPAIPSAPATPPGAPPGVHVSFGRGSVSVVWSGRPWPTAPRSPVTR